ncbi:MAG: flippase activity-associated protein Agl23, partial [Acidobacteriaceae bacterium]
DRPVFSSPIITIEKLIFVLILAGAIFTRFYMLEPRVMSHDETSHTYFSWLFYKGLDYAHDPVTHGPLQFHLVALSYFLFGDNDATARFPVAIFSVASVAFMWYFRRYFGRVGALIAALLLTISPFMLYYGRYVRNEAFVVFFAILMLWSILRYIDTGKPKYLYLFTAVTVLHFCTKETAFIYSAQALLFLAFYLVYRLLKREWQRKEYRSPFSLTLAISLVLLAVGMLLKYLGSKLSAINEPRYPFLTSVPSSIPLVLIVIGLIGLIGVLYLAISGFGLNRIRQERSFDLLMLLGTLVLPQLSAFAINVFGWKVPVNASEVSALTFTDMLHMAAIVVPIFVISILLGVFWNWRRWLVNAGIWYAIYIVLYTSMFTNGAGFFTGLVGSLGYWLEQQAVNRGDQPGYYYALIQVPMYEYLPAIGALIGMILALRGRQTVRDEVLEVELSSGEDQNAQELIASEEYEGQDTDQEYDKSPKAGETTQPANKVPVTGLLIFWSITSLLAYTIAGEKMPWLTVHITLPMILLAGWAVGYLVDTVDWAFFRAKKGWLVSGLLFVFVPALLSVLRATLGDSRPFAGKSLEQLAATSQFVISFIVMLACVIGMILLMKNWSPRMVNRGFSLVFLAFLGVLTAHTAFMASYVNYDTAKEYLVYAHCAPGDKIALQQITDISRRLTGGLDLTIAYDDKTTYPFWWYLRNFPNQRYYGGNPTRDLREVPIILVGQENFGKIEAVVGQAYDEFEYIRIWWPNMDYFNLTSERIKFALFDPQAREAIFQIWLNRDYKKYGELFGQDMSLQHWSPSEKLRLYIRKDVVNQLWDYGSTASSAPIPADPYEGKQVTFQADKIIGMPGTEPG